MIICPNCGKENQDHYKFCLGCGSDLPKSAAPEKPKTASVPPPAGGPAAPPPAQPAPATVEAPRATAAPAAGKPAAETAPAAKPQAAGGGQACPNCGSPVPDGFAFCGKCGHRILGVPPAQPVSTAPSPAKLVFIQPDGTPGGSLPLHMGENKIGRDSGGFLAGDPFLSPIHALFDVTSGGVKVKDPGSLNGIYVRIPPNTPFSLQHGDIIRIGQELLLFEMLENAEPSSDGTEVMGSPIEGLWGRISLIVGPGRTENAFPIGGDGVVLGRERGDVIFPEDGYVSGSHLKIQRVGLDRVEFVDLQSSNGTFMRVRDTLSLEKGAYMLMGQQLFQIMF